MRNLAIIVMMMFLVGGVACAATITFNDGRTVRGDIVKQDSKSLQINLDGVTMTYYADEIKDVDGKPFAADQTSPAANSAASAPVAAAPEAAAAPVAQAQPATQPEAVVPPPAAPAPAEAVASAPVVQAQPTAPAPAAPAEAVAPAPVASQAAPVVASDIIAPEKKDLILRFMDVFGTRQALAGNFEAMLTQIAKDKPDEAQTIRQRVKVDEIIERLLPIYDRNFTSEDLKSFISFYASVEGQKLIKTIPQLMKESVAESVKYMQEKFPEANKAQQ